MPCCHQELNPGPLEEQRVNFTADPSLQPMASFRAFLTGCAFSLSIFNALKKRMSWNQQVTGLGCSSSVESFASIHRCLLFDPLP